MKTTYLLGMVVATMLLLSGIASAETLKLTTKYTTNWTETDVASATLTYNTEGQTFDYIVIGTVPLPQTEYALIYYGDILPTGTTEPGVVGKIISKATSDVSGAINMAGSKLMESIPYPEDANSISTSNNDNPGAKIWLVPTTDIVAGTPKKLNWNNFGDYLFEENLDGAENGIPSHLITYTSSTKSLGLSTKDLDTWYETDVAKAKLTYIPSGNSFIYELGGEGLNPSTDYSLIYYKDVAPNPTTIPGEGIVIGTGTSNNVGGITMNGDVILGSIPQTDDANYVNGAKIWLIPSSDISETKLLWTNFGDYLFEENLREQQTEIPETSHLIRYNAEAGFELYGFESYFGSPGTQQTGEVNHTVFIDSNEINPNIVVNNTRNIGAIFTGSLSNDKYDFENPSNIHFYLEGFYHQVHDRLLSINMKRTIGTDETNINFKSNVFPEVEKNLKLKTTVFSSKISLAYIDTRPQLQNPVTSGYISVIVYLEDRNNMPEGATDFLVVVSGVSSTTGDSIVGSSTLTLNYDDEDGFTDVIIPIPTSVDSNIEHYILNVVAYELNDDDGKNDDIMETGNFIPSSPPAIVLPEAPVIN